jgi:DNA-binding transcriptional LysR family regulator
VEFQQLEMFAAVVEEGSVSRAAERVFRTAPAVSIAITKLEEEFGSLLFDRSDRQHPELTPSGRVLYSYARRILDLRQEANRAIKDGAQRRQGKLRIGTHESTSLYLLPSLLRPFQEAHPEIKTEIVCGTTDRLVRDLSQGAIDVAIVGEAPEDAEFDRELIFQDRLVFVVNPDHRLCSEEFVTVAELEKEVLLVQSTRSKLRQRLAHAFADAGITLNLGVENIAIEAMKRMVSENLGVGFMPRMCVEEELRQGKLTAISIAGVRDDWDLWLVRRKDQKQSFPTRKFLAIACARTPPAELKSQPGIRRATSAIPKPQAMVLPKRKTVHC